MSISSILADTLSNTQKDLSYFLNSYHTLNDDDRMELSRKIFNQLRDFFQAQKTMLDHVSKGNPSIAGEFAEYRGVENEVWEVYEHAIMMHVDEPDNEYKSQMERLQVLLRVFSKTEYQSLLERVQSQIDPETDKRILREVQKQPEMSFST